LGLAKTRLAADIGLQAAHDLHRRLLQGHLRRLTDDRWQAVLAVTPRAATHQWRWGGPRLLGWRMAAQRRGDLGARQAQWLTRGQATVLIGSDLPHVDRSDIAAAFRALAGTDLVFGPAVDGGYWLIGWSGRRTLPPGAFARVRWSTGHALADTQSSFGALGDAAALLDPRQDIDTIQEYRAWLNRI